MKVELKTWTGLGLATALIGASLSGCAGEGGEGEAGEGGEAAQTADAGEMGEGGESGEGEGGEGGEGTGGEGGEGGVMIASAASDPIVYATALAVAEAHAIAARDAYAAGNTDAAAEMFGHPVGEVLAEMDPVFAELGVVDFKPLFFDASAAILDGADTAQVESRYDGIIAALQSAADKAPDNGTSDAAIAAGVSADMIERAIEMYPRAIEIDRYEPYLDGYGYFKTAESTFAGSSSEILTENEAVHAAISEALAVLAQAYPGVEKPAELNADQGELLAAGSKIKLAL